MKILHISLGTPKFRSGGLPLYNHDLMKVQKKMGYDVSMLYPGHFDFLKKTRLKTKKNNDYEVFEVINPNFVAIPFGINNPSKFMSIGDVKVYRNFLIKLKPEVIHVHTLMGIQSSFFEAAEELGIPMVYTTHDYYPLCCKTNMIDFEGKLCDEISPERCARCNSSVTTTSLMQYLMQSSTYQNFKKSLFFSYIRKNKKNKLKVEQPIITKEISKDCVEEYSQLNKYRLNILKKMSKIHCNSSIAKDVYEEYINVEKEVISITLRDIKDNRKLIKRAVKDKVKIGYIGSKDPYKGLEVLLNASNLLVKDKIDFELNIYGDDFSSLEISSKLNCIKHGRFPREKLGNIMGDLDLLIIPSIWKETFGFTALEAISYGVPVMVSEYVGAKDIVEKIDSRCLFKPTVESLYKKMKYFIENNTYRKDLNEKLHKAKIKFEMEEHAKEMIRFYEDVVEKND